MSRPLVRVPGSRIREWNRIVCRTDMSQVKLMFLSTSDTLSSSLLGDTLKLITCRWLYKCYIMFVVQVSNGDYNQFLYRVS